MNTEVTTYFKLFGAFDPDVITTETGIMPTTMFRPGAVVGRTRPPVDYSGWWVKVGPEETLDAQAQVQVLLDLLSPALAKLAQLRADFGLEAIISIVAYVDSMKPYDNVPIIGLSASQILAVSTLGAEIDVDIMLLAEVEPPVNAVDFDDG